MSTQNPQDETKDTKHTTTPDAATQLVASIRKIDERRAELKSELTALNRERYALARLAGAK